MTDPQVPYLDVECPTCGAQRNQHCMNLIRSGWITVHCHQARKAAHQRYMDALVLAAQKISVIGFRSEVSL